MNKRETNGIKIKNKQTKNQMSDPKNKCQMNFLEMSLGVGVSRKRPLRS